MPEASLLASALCKAIEKGVLALAFAAVAEGFYVGRGGGVDAIFATIMKKLYSPDKWLNLAIPSLA